MAHFGGLAATMGGAAAAFASGGDATDAASAYAGCCGGGAVLGGGSEDKEMKEVVRAMRDYRDSGAMKVKEELVGRLVRAANSSALEFGIEESDDLVAVARKLREKLPDPRRGDSFDAKDFGPVCEAIAKALNEQFPQTGSNVKLIDTRGGPQSVCRSVHDFVLALAAGINFEFVEVHSAAQIALRKLTALRELIAKLKSQSRKALTEDADDRALAKAEPLLDAGDKMDREVDKLVLELSGILQASLAPGKIELETLLAEGDDLMKRLQKDFVPGESDFSDSIASAFAGLPTLAGIAARANVALQKTGLELDEFAAAHSAKELDDALDKLRARVMKERPDDIGTFERAAQVLMSAHKRDGIAAAMRDQDAKIKKHGGAKKTEIERRQEKRDLERKLILKQYIMSSGRVYDRFLAAVKVVGPRLGKEIPVTMKLEALRDAMQRLADMNVPKLDLTIIGFYRGAQARSTRERFLAQLRLIQRAVDDIVASDVYSGHAGRFQPIRAAIDDMVELVNRYSDIVTKRYGGGDGDSDAEDAPADGAEDAPADEPHSGELADGPLDGPLDEVGFDTTAAAVEEDAVVRGRGVLGGAEVGVEFLDMAEQLRSSLDIKSAINDFLYFFWVAKVRENLRVTAPEIEKYGEKYDEVLADAVAGRLHLIAEERKVVLKGTDVAQGEPGAQAPDADHLGSKPHSAAAIAAAAPGNRPAMEAENKSWEEAKKSIETEYATKQEFYRLVQAVDLYMKAFAHGITADPEAVADIKKELDGIPMISKWYTDATGDDLTKFFDNTQAAAGGRQAGGEGNRPEGAPASTIAIGDGHYYEAVAAAPADVGTGGAVDAQNAEQLRKTVGSALSNFQALKNLVNAFARMGARFGGEDLKKKVFMSPAEMYRIMIKFLRISAVSTRVVDNGGWNANLAGGGVAQAAGAAEGARMVFATPARDNGSLKASTWATENMYFHFIVKCIGAKILTVIGTFDLLERPEPMYELTPTRIILGGAEGAVEVIPEAAELYFRLPRLAEFYKNLFNFDMAGNDLQISMLPELDGAFSALITEIFVRSAAAASTGDYSDIESDRLIVAVNRAYEAHRSEGDNAAKKTISAFIVEINRRYGLIKKDDYQRIEKMQREYAANTGQLNAPASTNYAILPDEESSLFDNDEKRRAPADRYALPADAGKAGDTTYRPGKQDPIGDRANNASWRMVQDFRDKLAKEMQSFSSNKQPVTYRTLIEQARADMDKGDAAKRREVALRLIQGSQMLSGSSHSQALMFHETVVAGLNMLTAIHDSLAALRAKVRGMDIDAVSAKFVELLGAAGAAPANPAWAQGVLNDLGFDQARYLIPAAADNGALKNRFPALDADAANNTKTFANVWAWIDASARNGGGGFDAAEAEPRAQQAARMVVNRQLVMKDLILTLFELTSDFGETVSVRYPGSSLSKIHLDFSKLRGMCEGLIGNVRTFLAHFRPLMDSATINRFESDTAKGSLRWLEENLVDGFLKASVDASGRRRDDPAAGTTGELELLSSRVNKIMVRLTETYAAVPDLRGNAGAPGAALVADWNDGKVDEYGATLSGLVFWDAAADNNSGVAGAYGALGGKMGRFIAGPLAIGAAPGAGNPTIKGRVWNGANNVYVPADVTQRARTYEDGGLTEDRSLMFSFNQALHMYIAQNYDAASGKIYQSLIDAFANGAFSQAVMVDGYSQPDVGTAGAAGFGVRGDPTSRSVLLTSIATMLQRLIKDMTNQGVSRHLVASLAEIPLYLKENYRATLPVFTKMFDFLAKQGELIKQLIQRCAINCGRRDLVARGAVRNGAALVGANTAAVVAAAAANTIVVADDADTPTTWPVGSFVKGTTLRPLGDYAANRDATVQPAIIDVIDGVNAGCYALSKIAGNVLRELADEPLYLQTSESSIQDYKTRYGKSPLMPFSLAMHVLKDLPAGAAGPVDQDMLPIQAVGATEFRFLYGTRGLLASKPVTGLASMPGVAALLKDYNMAATGRDKLEEEVYTEFVGTMADALRFLVDMRSYRSALVKSAGTFGPEPLLGGVAPESAVFPLRGPVPTLTAVLEVTDSSYQEQRIQAIIGTGLVAANSSPPLTGTAGARAQERLQNLVDLNIPPIVPHALMRSMALANLYNYGYSFEQLACMYYGRSREAVSLVDTTAAQGAGPPALPPRDTKDFFLKMLMEPFAEVSESQYGSEDFQRGTAGYFQRMCRGDNSLAMGRPKFLSDQIFNKVLFGSTFPSQADFDEGGAGVAAGISRGRNGFGPLGRTRLDGAGQYLEVLPRIGADLENFGAGLTAAGAPLTPGNVRLGMADIMRSVARVGGVPGANAANLPAGAPAAVTNAIAAFAQVGAENLAQMLTSPAMAVLVERVDLPAGAPANLDAVFAAVGQPGALPAAVAATLNTGVVLLDRLAVPGSNAAGAQAPVTAANANNVDYRMILRALGRGIPAAPPADRNAAVQLVAREIVAYLKENGVINGTAFLPRLLAAKNAIQASLRQAGLPTSGVMMGYQTDVARAPDMGAAAGEYEGMITYLDEKTATTDPDHYTVKQVGMTNAAEATLRATGRNRFDSAIIRNLTFITNVYRLTRAKMSHELQQQRSIIEKGDPTVSAEMTEFDTSPTRGTAERAGEREFWSERTLWQ